MIMVLFKKISSTFKRGSGVCILFDPWQCFMVDDYWWKK